MKKHIMLILSAILIAIPVFAQSGEDIDGVNYCTKVNRYDVSKVTSISFPDSHYTVQEVTIHIELLL